MLTERFGDEFVWLYPKEGTRWKKALLDDLSIMLI